MNRFHVLTYILKTTNSRTLNKSTRSQVLFFINNIDKLLNRCLSEMVPRTEITHKSSAVDEIDKVDLPARGGGVKARFNFAMYADKSPIIQKYIDLGVNLYELEKNPPAANYLLTLSPNKMNRYLLFLTDNGVTADKLGDFITKNPFIFKEDLDDLQVRINYLKSKKFDREMISNIITKYPKFLSNPVKKIDEQLGFIQQTFRLKGDQVRHMVTKVPSIAVISKDTLDINIHALKEELNLDVYELKKVIVSEPHLLRISSYDLVSTYEYLIKTMNVSKMLILNQPRVLTYRKFIIQQRHKFLESLGRAQYCHLLPGYVDLLSLVTTTDSEFCEKIAKSSEKLYYDFLKTL